MIKSYFILAWRNLFKRKWYSLINVLGLALGVSVCMLLILYINRELHFDDFLQEGSDVYRLVVERKYPGRTTAYATIPQSYAAAVKYECPEVKEYVRVFDFLGGGSIQYKYGDENFEERKVLFVDSTFFRIFNHTILAGDRLTPLDHTRSCVMDETTAKKYFGSVAHAINKMILPEGNGSLPVKVTAVCQDWPSNSHLTFNILESTAGQEGFREENYVNFQAYTYLKLNPQATANAVESKFPDIIRKYAAGNIARAFAMPFDDFFKAGNGYHYYLQPLQKIHLISHLDSELKPNGSIQSIYIFGAIAVIILLLAIINFVNLATARASERAKEVGIRKTFGSEKKALIFQFLTEATLVSILSMVFALISIYLLLPAFQKFTGSQFSFLQIVQPINLLYLLSLALATGLIAGIYPAFVLSSFKPITVLKGRFSSTGLGVLVRNGLVIFQFTISVVLIICTLIVNNQMHYMMGNELGYNKDHTILLDRTDVLGGQTKVFKEALLNSGYVQHVTSASAFPGDENYFGISWRKPGDLQPMTGRGIFADANYQNTFGLSVTEGRFFSKDFNTDSLAVVLNESAVKELNLISPIGKNLISEEPFLNNPDGSQKVYKIIGVVKDYNYQSLHLPITPLVFTNAAMFNEVTASQAVKLKPGHLQDALSSIEKIWSQFVKNRPLDFEFMDQTIAQQYNAELKTQRIFTFFSSLAIFIACIGLLGLAAFACHQRMKEISMRKVLGASMWSVIRLLSGKFLTSILVAIVIAFPLSWYLMNQWLNDFSYRVVISPIHFIWAGLLALGVALVTISFTIIKTSRVNAIQSLRSE